MMVVLFAGCKLDDYELTILKSDNISLSEKIVFMAENRFYGAQYAWRSRELIGHWHWYENNETYTTYDITDSGYVWINRSDLKEEGFPMLLDLSVTDTLSIFYSSCGGYKLHYSFKNDTLLLVDEDYRTKNPVLRYKGIKCDKSKCNPILDFYCSQPVFINLPSAQKMVTGFTKKHSLQTNIYIGKPKKRLREKYLQNQYLIDVGHHYPIEKEEIEEFISRELDKLDESERSKLEVYLNADKDTPLTMIDSIKTVIHTAYPNLKLYRAVLQAETGKIGKIKL